MVYFSKGQLSIHSLCRRALRLFYLRSQHGTRGCTGDHRELTSMTVIQFESDKGKRSISVGCGDASFLTLFSETDGIRYFPAVPRRVKEVSTKQLQQLFSGNS